jgi:hypothetical protein
MWEKSCWELTASAAFASAWAATHPSVAAHESAARLHQAAADEHEENLSPDDVRAESLDAHDLAFQMHVKCVEHHTVEATLLGATALGGGQ